MKRALFAALLAPLLAGCITAAQIHSKTWLTNSPLPAALCEREPELKDYGFYRRLDDGKFELISFCNPLAAKMLGMHKDDYKDLLGSAGVEKIESE